METLIRRIGAAKAAIDNGFSRVGPSLSSGDRADGWLMGAASRAITLADAVVLLCKHHHANEALPVLRGLLETAAAMRWVASGPDPERLSAVERQAQSADWGELWSAAGLVERLRSSGVPAAECAELAAALAAHVPDHARSGSMGLPWSHAFPGNRHDGSGSEQVLGWAARAMRYALEALDVRWPKAFTGAEELWR